MNNALNSVDDLTTRSLDQRLERNPVLRERVHRLLDVIDAAADDCVTAAQAEARVVEEIRKMGVEALTAWSERADAEAQQTVRTDHPKAVRDSKKNSTGIRSSERSG
jgi:hypothetical protein